MRVNSDSVILRIVIVFQLASICLLLAAAAKVDITPQTSQWLMGYGPRKSTAVHDPIYHRVVAMDDGRSRFYLVSRDLCLFSPEVYDEVAAELKQKLKIEPKQFWWSVTHSHSTPEVGPHGVYDVLLKGRSDHEWDREYTQQVKTSLISAIEAGLQETGAGAPADRHRHIERKYQSSSEGRRWQDQSRPQSRWPGGPADRTDSPRTARRNTIALVANYAIHGTVLSGRSEAISGDAPGVVSAYVEEKLGAPVLFVNGAAGNGPDLYRLPGCEVRAPRRVPSAARRPHSAGECGYETGTSDVQIRTGETRRNPLKPGLEWPASCVHIRAWIQWKNDRASARAISYNE